VLLINEEAAVSDYLQGKRWAKRESFEGYSLFVHGDFASVHRQSLEEAQKSASVLAYEPRIREVLAAVPALTPSIVEAMAVFDINTRVVSLADIVDRVSFTGDDRYLLLRGYSEKSIVILGV
jgi:hypothetical protein